MRRRSALRFVLLFAAADLALAVPPGARPAEARKGRKAAEKAVRMEKVGKAAYRKGKYEDALIAFEAAFEADPQPKHLYNLARCHEQQGDLAKATEFYGRYLREAPEAEDRDAVATRAEFLTTKLRKTMARLEVVSEPPGAGLRIEGEGDKIDVTTPWAGWLAPGRYDVSVLLPHDQEYRKLVALAAGQERKVEARAAGEGGEAVAAVRPSAPDTPGPEEPPAAPAAAPAAPVAAPAAPVAAPAAAEAPDARGMGAVPLAAFGLGAAALVSWGVFGGLAMSGQGEFDDGTGAPRASGKTRGEIDDLAEATNLYGAVANVSLAVAAAAGLTGGAVLLLSGDGTEGTAAVRWAW